MSEYLLIITRSVFTFIILLVLARFMGKQQLSQLTYFDYIVGITIGDISASLAVDQNMKVSNGLIGLIIWAMFSVLMALISLKSFKFRKLTSGKPTVIIQEGKVHEKNLKRLRLSVDELMPLLRAKDAFKLSDIEMAVMETDGKVNVLKKTDASPVTPKAMGLQVEQEKQPQIVVLDGKVLENSLNQSSYTRDWLLGEVTKQGAADFSDVFLAQIDSTGNVYVDLYQDKLKKPEVQAKPLLKATLKKTQADLELFASQTNNKEAKRMYAEQANKLQQTIDSIQSYLN